jgi:hypothetical protein
MEFEHEFRFGGGEREAKKGRSARRTVGERRAGRGGRGRVMVRVMNNEVWIRSGHGEKSGEEGSEKRGRRARCVVGERRAGSRERRREGP